MPLRLTNLWSLEGLSPLDLIRRTARACWRDDVFGQGGRMAFYHFLAIFPSLLVLYALTSRVPHVAGPVRSTVSGVLGQVLPGKVLQLFQETMTGLQARSHWGISLVFVCAGATWAALNGTWAMIHGLNDAYEVNESRSWRSLSVTIVGLTVSLAAAGSLAAFVIFCGRYIQERLGEGPAALDALEWLVVALALSSCFALFYRFGPSLTDHQWRWSTPGAGCAMLLWIASTLGARFYFDHVNYARSYGSLSSVVMLLLWLYVTNGVILIGGEMNSEIEKAARPSRRRRASRTAY